MKDTNPKDAIANNKVPLSLCSPVAQARWAEAMVSGRQKYGAFNYRVCGARASVYIEGAMRHLQRYLCGQDLDPDDLVTNLGAAMANISIIIDAEASGTLVDDRPPSTPLDAVYADVEDSVKRLRKKYDDKDPKHYTIEDSTPEVQDRMLEQAIDNLDRFFDSRFEEPSPPTEKPVPLELKIGAKVKCIAPYFFNHVGRIGEVYDKATLPGWWRVRFYDVVGDMPLSPGELEVVG